MNLPLLTLTRLPDPRPGRWPHAGVEAELPALIHEDLTAAEAAANAGRPLVMPRLERAVAAARGERDPHVLGRCLYAAAALALHAARPLRAYEWGLEAQPLLERLDDRWRATIVLLTRARCCVVLDEHERARGLVEEALHRFQGLDDRAGMVLCHQTLALAFEGGHDPASGLPHALRALELAAEQPALWPPLIDLCARLRLQHGEALAAGGDWPGAAEAFALALLQLIDALPTAGPDGAAADEADHWRTCLLVARAAGDDSLEREALCRLAACGRRAGRGPTRGLACLSMAERQRRRGRTAPALARARRALQHLPAAPSTAAAHLMAKRLEAALLEAAGDLAGAYAAQCEAARVEHDRQRRTVAARAELRLLDLNWERERRRSEQTLAYAQRLSNVGHLVASVNHELNQPMASIRLMAETTIALIEAGETAEPAANIRQLHRLSEHLHEVTSKLAAFPAAATTLPQQQVSLVGAIDEALALVHSRLAQTPCDIERRIGDVRVNAQAGQLMRVIANLVNNALDAMAALPQRRIVFSCTSDNRHVTLTVRDNGPGLPASVRARLFQPFFSTKPAGLGLGLGLALSRQVMQEMGGDLRASASADEGGAAFDLVLPASGPAHTGRDAAYPPGDPSHASHPPAGA